MRLLLAIVFVAVLAGCGGGHPAATRHHGRSRPAPQSKPATPASFAHALTASHLAPGSQPSALPGDILIADRSNNRLLVVDPQGRVVWQFGDAQTLPLPDDAFFAPDARAIVATEEDVDAISVVNIAAHRVTWRYGTLNSPGSAPGHLAHPDDAMLTPGGAIVSADIENCRLIELRPPSHRLVRALGSPTRGCVHSPPDAWASPNGAFPLQNGGWLVTEINGDWVDALSPSGRLLWATHPPGIYYPSDTNEVRPGLYLTVGWQSPGVLEEFTRSGRLVWRYRPRPGDPPLDHPSLAEPLPNGDVLVTDDFNDRVIVVDPRTNRIVWQYGHTGVPGSSPGYLSRPDGLDLAPPRSLLAGRRAKMPLR
ncbi:MAG TPA: hypothetical protein VFA37_06890 [Gaiellaceae bacterium]|nr:hypothetical protein [Gaiellaceae bacterium]